MKNLPDKIYLSFGEMSEERFEKEDYKEICEYSELVVPNEQKIWKTDVEYIRKDALVKYLSEEKGYPITLNGELLHLDELNKHLAEYNKWKKNDFIKKACAKLKKLMYDNLMFQGRLHREEVIDNFVENFKNYIKGK